MNDTGADAKVTVRQSYHDYEDNAWLRGLFRPFLIAVVAASAIVGLHAFSRAAFGWSLDHVLPLAFLAALEGGYSTLQRGRPGWRDRRGLLFRVGELVLLLLVLRLADWAIAGGAPTTATISRWAADLGLLFDDRFLFAALLLLIPWGLAITMTGDFLDLAIQPDEYAAQANLGWGESASALRVGRPVSRAETVRNFVRRWAWGGLLLMVTSVAGQVSVGAGPGGFPRVGLAGAGLSPAVLAGLIAYFLGGLLLISQARLALLRATWFNEGIAVSPSVLRRWHVTAALALLLVAGIASLLPLGSTGGLAPALYWLIAALVRALYTVFLVFVFLLLLVVYWLHRLFPTEQESLPPPRLETSPFHPLPPAAGGGLPAWLTTAIFWLVALVVVGYLLLTYLRAQDWWSGPLAAYWRRFVSWFRAHWQRVRRAAAAAGATIRARLAMPALRAPSAPGTRLVRPGRLPPRARVRYFYLSTLRRAAQRGLARPPAKTPHEFVKDLQDHWPDADVDLQALTGAFVEARYSDRQIRTGEARSVEGVWARVLRALRRKGRPSAGPPAPGPGNSA